MASPTDDSLLEEETKPQLGPISQQANYRRYLQEHRVPEMFESLIASLMLERPVDMVDYLHTQVQAIQNIGIENIDWETFIYKLHPTRDPVHKELIKDEDFKEKQKGERRVIPPPHKAVPSQVRNEDEPYQPTVFKLTEPAENEDEDSS